MEPKKVDISKLSTCMDNSALNKKGEYKRERGNEFGFEMSEGCVGSKI